MAVLLRIARQIVVHAHHDVQLLVGVGKRQFVRVAGHIDAHLHFLVDDHEASGEIKVVQVVAINNEKVVARNERYHVVLRKLELIVDIFNQRIAREGEVVQAVVLEARGVLDTLDVGRLPVVSAMDESIVEHFAFAADDVEREREATHHVLQRDDGIVELLAIGIKQHGLHFGTIVDVVARQVEVLAQKVQRHAKRQQKKDSFLHLGCIFGKNTEINR